MAYDIPRDDYGKFFDVVSEPSNLAAAKSTRNLIQQIEMNYYRSGTTSIVYLQQDFMLESIGTVFKKYSPFLEIYNEILGRLESNGFMEFWRRNFIFSSQQIEEIGPQVLTMDHLRLGFLACLFPMALGVIAFLAEILTKFCAKKNKVDKKSKRAPKKKLENLQLLKTEPTASKVYLTKPVVVWEAVVQPSNKKIAKSNLECFDKIV